jgi:ABC-2 type transport system ATP-binding protein
VSTVISFDHVTKQYGPVSALSDFSAHVSSGRVTAFLGANGSGKTTSMRILLGLAEPTSGSASINGSPYATLRHPLRKVGAVLDQGLHPHRTARNHLRVVAAQASVNRARVDEVLAVVELTQAADRRVGGFSLGMRQRLSVASALIGDPEILVLDEPFNGLDPDGINALRLLLRRFAGAGGTVLLSSHLLAEVAHSADDAIIIDRGHLISAGPLAELAPRAPSVVVATADADLLAVALQASGAIVSRSQPGTIIVTASTPDDIGRIALDVGAVIVGMRTDGDDLEAIFHALIHPTGTAHHRQEVTQ